MPFTENRKVFLRSADFAYDATYNAATVPVILDLEFVDDAGFQSTGPIIMADIDDFAGAQQKENIIIDGITYTLEEFQPEGTGFIYIRMHEV